MSARRWLLVAAAAAALLLVVGRVGGALYVDRAWYAAMGAESLWRTMLLDTLLLRGVTALLGTAFVFANLYSVRHSIVSLVLPRRVGDLEIGEEVPGRTLMLGVLLLSAALGALLTIPYGDWTLLAQAWRGLPYGELDPFHQVDLGFYVHWLPLEVALYHWALLVLLVVSLVVVALYALTPSLRWDRGTLRVTNYVRRHLVVLGALALLLLAWSYRLDQFRLLVLGSGTDGMFTWADHRVRTTGNAVLSVLAVVMAGLVLLTGWMGQMRRAFIGVTIVLVLSVVLRQALPAIQERTQAPREPGRREAPYERTRAIYSRRAVALESLFPADSLEMVPRAVPVPAAIAAWDARALARAIALEHRGTALVGDLGWRAGEGGLEALAIVRPSSEASGDPAVAWSSVRAAGGEVNDGLPDDVDRPLPPPLSWPGARGWQLVQDGQNVVPGARLTSRLARWAHAWGEQNPRFASADFAGATRKLVLRRDVRERVGALAPFFAQGEQVVPVLAPALHWVVHLYAATDWYPLAAPFGSGDGEWRAQRLAATAIVEAATGRVRLVPAAERDALAETWIRMFPELFTPVDSLPPALASQLPPDVDGALASARVLAAAGLRRDPQPVAREVAADEGDTLAASPLTPFATPRGVAVSVPLLDATGALSGLVVAVGGPRPFARWLPAAGSTSLDAQRDRLVRGADSVAIGRDARLVTGALRLVPVVPAGQALVVTHYRWRGDAPPEVVRVAAALGDTLRAAPTLSAALGLAGPGEPADSAGVAGETPARAAALYDRMREALRRGDWKAFGEAFDALGRALGRAPRP